MLYGSRFPLSSREFVSFFFVAVKMLVLLLFNHHEVLTTKQICEATNISLEVLNAHILSLAHPKSKVLLKHPNTPKLEDADVFRLNDKFSSKTYRTKIALIKTKEEVKVEEEERQIEIETLRKHQYFVKTLCLFDNLKVSFLLLSELMPLSFV